MKRIVMMVLRNLIFVPYGWIKLCYYASHVDKYTEEERYRLLKYIDSKANKGGSVHIEAHGVENIPKENGFMFFPNHQGLYDVLAIIDACPVPFSVVAKKEIGNIPFLKQVFACMGSVRFRASLFGALYAMDTLAASFPAVSFACRLSFSTFPVLFPSERHMDTGKPFCIHLHQK